MSSTSDSAGRNCPLCGERSRSREWLAPRVFKKLSDEEFSSRTRPSRIHPRFLICEPCDTVYADWALEEARVLEKYREAPFVSSLESQDAARTYARLLRQFGCKRLHRESALEVGSADGAFLKELGGFGFQNILGIEPNLMAVQSAESWVQERTLRCSWKEAASSLPEGQKFSLICSFQTLEHSPSPQQWVQGWAGRLRPGGVLMLAQHDFRSMANRAMGRFSPIYDAQHYQVFSKASLAGLVRASGLQVRFQSRYLNTYHLSYLGRLLGISALEKDNRISKVVQIPFPAGNQVLFAERS